MVFERGRQHMEIPSEPVVDRPIIFSSSNSAGKIVLKGRCEIVCIAI